MSLSEERRPLVLLHGWGMNAAVWAPLQARLEPRWRIWTPELPGHGRAAWPVGDGRLDAWARAVLEAAPPRALWLGWSLGGLVALRAAVLAPERVVGLLSVASSPCFVQRPQWTPALAPGLLESFADGLAHQYRETLDRFLALQFHGVRGGRETLRRCRALLAERPEPRPEALTEGLELLRGYDLRAQLAHLEVPCAWLLGGRDRLVPPALADHLPDRRSVRILPEAGHAPFLSHPAEVAAMLEQAFEHD